MKKFLLGLMLAVSSLSVYALDQAVFSFVSPATGIFLTNNTTTLFGYTNVEYIAPGGMLDFSFTTNVIVPTYVGGTTINGVNYNGTVYYTNPITGSAGSLTNGFAWHDVSLFPNANADLNIPALTLYANMTTDGGALSSNMVTMTFVREYGTNVDTGASGFANPDTFVVAFALIGATNTVGSTNLTTVFQQGATGIRLQKVVLANSTTNLFVRINDLGISGYKP